ncbi:hypothetical protein U9M48_005183 [Paspalum notatum var. saurae]|uniref:F-box domain-containing protein n=1 Tax=Paspalum notatum var. saurae TaxID=547442 RepID=A0AAQ3SLA7_PASNO
MRAVKAPNGASAATLASDGSDLIGALPDELLHHVLSFLPAQQSVRTCVLARRWLDLWKSATRLRIAGAADGKHRASFSKVRELVDHIVLLRGGSPLETFEFCFDGLSDADVPRVNLWIQHALACRAQVLRLNIVWDLSSRNTSRIRPDDAPLVSQHLTRAPWCAVKDKFANFSCCPSLRVLQIEDCNLTHANRISCQSLEHLRIYGTSFSYSRRIRIHAPNLVTLQLRVHYGRTPVLETASPLLWAVVTVHDGGADLCRHLYSGDCYDGSCQGCRNIRNDNSCILLQGLSQAKNLVFFQLGLKRRDLQWCLTFSMLKTLVLNENWCVPNVDALASVLEHSPVLEELFLQLFSKGLRYKVQMKGRFNPKELPSTISAHLKRVEVKCEVVDETVLNVLKFLSKHMELEPNVCVKMQQKEMPD